MKRIENLKCHLGLECEEALNTYWRWLSKNFSKENKNKMFFYELFSLLSLSSVCVDYYILKLTMRSRFFCVFFISEIAHSYYSITIGSLISILLLRLFGSGMCILYYYDWSPVAKCTYLLVWLANRYYSHLLRYICVSATSTELNYVL